MDNTKLASNDAKFNASEYLEYLGFKKVKNGWKDSFGCFLYESKVPTELSELIRVITGTTFVKGYSEGYSDKSESKENRFIKQR